MQESLAFPKRITKHGKELKLSVARVVRDEFLTELLVEGSVMALDEDGKGLKSQ